MIELGEKEYELNMKFGQHIAEVCDEVILVGKEQTKPIYEGLMSKGYNEKNIHVINDVKVAFKLMQELNRITSYNVCYTKLLRFVVVAVITYFNIPDHNLKDRLIESILSGITLAMAMIV